MLGICTGAPSQPGWRTNSTDQSILWAQVQMDLTCLSSWSSDYLEKGRLDDGLQSTPSIIPHY